MNSPSSQPEWIITSDQLKNSLEKVTLVDVREPEEFEECRIEGCKLIPLGELEFRAEKELKKEDDIVIYCAHGMRSLQGVMMLRMLGFQKLRSLEGGIEAWKDAGNPA
jgi:adenylyltransferase/sulfurtransferase